VAFISRDNRKYFKFCTVITFILLSILIVVDLSSVPALNVIKMCIPEDRIVTFIYKLMLSVNCVFPFFWRFILAQQKCFLK